ncbi:centrosomal protein 43-like [Aricia agestis]|uniref:centrosomal protein 43-like n=1 Tax=Aricia agestis TaxID=91739 RepID=UPI001C20585E|nr:centrosomal protein 43-like [Aricia agestis]
MAQTEDTELRDLVVEALEKNGSLAKIRALLRANIFLAFEDERENQKQNESLDKILNQPEGKLSLCIIHEFLEFCNLKNTLFVYKSESRQGREYTYKSEDILAKLNVPKVDRDKEPILLTILKNVIKFFSNKHNSNDKPKPKGDQYKDEQNCTYIVHEDSSSTSSSQSDNSSDEKNKINLRLPLDNSDTDTTSDSIGDKNSSEYMPNSQNLISDIKTNTASNNITLPAHNMMDKSVFSTNSVNKKSDNFLEPKNFNSSTDSTSYMELQPVQHPQEVLSNTPGSPLSENKLQKTKQNYSSGSQNESSSIHTLSNTNNIKKDSNKESLKNSISRDDSGLNETEVMEYSYDFSPPNSEPKTSTENSPKSIRNPGSAPNNSSSPSSISISDVADLLSEKSFKNFSRDSKNDSNTTNKSRLSSTSKRRFSPNKDPSKMNSDHSRDFSESSIPSLSNLSLEIHSE